MIDYYLLPYALNKSHDNDIRPVFWILHMVHSVIKLNFLDNKFRGQFLDKFLC